MVIGLSPDSSNSITIGAFIALWQFSVVGFAVYSLLSTGARGAWRRASVRGSTKESALAAEGQAAVVMRPVHAPGSATSGTTTALPVRMPATSSHTDDADEI